MAAWKHLWTKYLVLFIIIGVFLLGIVECRRGGSRSGGIRSSRTTRTTRRTSSSSSSVRYYRGPSYTGSWKSAAAAGAVFGLMSYKTRSMYRRHPNREPAICFNENELKNGTFGYFVCPQRYDPDDLAKCCGADDAEYCCEGSLSAGATAGIVIGVIALVGIIAGCVIWRNRAKKRAKSGHVISKDPKTENDPLNPTAVYQPANTDTPVSWNTPPGAAQPYSTEPAKYPYYPENGSAYEPPPPQPVDGYQPANPEPYPPQPYQPGAFAPQPYPPQQYGIQQPEAAPIGFDGTNKGALPEGDVSGGLPYPSNPGMGYPPQGQPNVPPPAYPGNQPY